VAAEGGDMSPLDYVKAIVGVAVLAVVFLLGRGCGIASNVDDVRAAEKAAAKTQVSAANKARDEALAALETEQAAAKDAKTRADAEAANAANYLESLNNANDKADRLAGDVRAGDVRFRRLWAQCQTLPATEGAADGEPAVDAGADDRAASAARIVRAAAQCDAQVKALQQQIIDDRK
jgi:hypothetical protein